MHDCPECGAECDCTDPIVCLCVCLHENKRCRECLQPEDDCCCDEEDDDGEDS